MLAGVYESVGESYETPEEMTRELINALKSLISKKENAEDPDRQFMISLVPDFKKVPDR